MDTAFLITAFVTLFVIIDPIGMTPLFVALTQGIGNARRRAIAIRACITSALLLIVFAAFGEAVLGFIGISMPAFRIAGGLLLFLTALDMLFERRGQRRKGQADAAEEDEGDDPSIFPLAIPLIAGPGDERDGQWKDRRIVALIFFGGVGLTLAPLAAPLEQHVEC